MYFLIIMYLIIIHELGHFVTAIILNVKVNKIYIYPFGGISKLNMRFNIKKQKEILILIMGPIFQLIGYYVIINIPFFINYYKIINIYNYSILIFNLLPIYPLDGAKLLNILLSSFIPLKKSYIISIIISYITIILMILMIKNKTINLLFIVIFLLYKITSEYKKIKYYYEKFLLERYLYKYKFKNVKIINDINNFYRDKKHLVYINNKYYTEKEILEKKYKKY